MLYDVKLLGRKMIRKQKINIANHVALVVALDLLCDND